MNFRPELAEEVMAGNKSVTRRLTSPNPRSPWYEGGCKLVVGRDYAVCPGRGKHAIGYVEIVEVTREWFYPDRILSREAHAEGFPTAQDFRETWMDLHGSLDGPVDVWRIRFVIAQRSAVI